MTRIATVTGAALAALLLASSGASAAESACGAAPAPPEIPADGATLDGKGMEAIAQGLDVYQAKFKEFNDCMINEHNVTIDKFTVALKAYQEKNKKK